MILSYEARARLVRRRKKRRIRRVSRSETRPRGFWMMRNTLLPARLPATRLHLRERCHRPRCDVERSIHSPQKQLDRHAVWQAIQTPAFHRHSDRVFMRHARRFARVAAPAGHDDIVDCVAAPARKGHSMVDCPFAPGKPNTTVATVAVGAPQGLQLAASYDTIRLIFPGGPVGGSRSLIKPVTRHTSSIPPMSAEDHSTIVPGLSLKALVQGLVGLRRTPALVRKQRRIMCLMLCG